MKALTETAILVEIEKINKICERQTIRMDGYDKRLFEIKNWCEIKIAGVEQLSKEIFERIRALEKVNDIDLGIDSLLCPIMKSRKIYPATDPRIGRLCWVWMRGQYCKRRAFRITGVFPDGYATDDNPKLWDHAELVKPEEL